MPKSCSIFVMRNYTADASKQIELKFLSSFFLLLLLQLLLPQYGVAAGEDSFIEVSSACGVVLFLDSLGGS